MAALRLTRPPAAPTRSPRQPKPPSDPDVPTFRRVQMDLDRSTGALRSRPHKQMRPEPLVVERADLELLGIRRTPRGKRKPANRIWYRAADGSGLERLREVWPFELNDPQEVGMVLVHHAERTEAKAEQVGGRHVGSIPTVVDRFELCRMHEPGTWEDAS